MLTARLDINGENIGTLAITNVRALDDGRHLYHVALHAGTDRARALVGEANVAHNRADGAVDLVARAAHELNKTVRLPA